MARFVPYRFEVRRNAFLSAAQRILYILVLSPLLQTSERVSAFRGFYFGAPPGTSTDAGQIRIRLLRASTFGHTTSEPAKQPGVTRNRPLRKCDVTSVGGWYGIKRDYRFEMQIRGSALEVSIHETCSGASQD
jgi:hypothetical protein